MYVHLTENQHVSRCGNLQTQLFPELVVPGDPKVWEALLWAKSMPRKVLLWLTVAGRAQPTCLIELAKLQGQSDGVFAQVPWAPSLALPDVASLERVQQGKAGSVCSVQLPFSFISIS